MIHAAVALVMLLAQDPPFEYERWGAWASFGEGSTITWSWTFAGKPTTSVTTLAKRTGTSLTLKTVHGFEGRKERAPDATIEKSGNRKENPRYIDSICPKCSKHKLAESSWSREKLKVGARELDCQVERLKWLTCNGGVGHVTRTWYSKEVPSWIVRDETEGRDASTTMTVAFEAKPVPAGEVEAEPFDVLAFKRAGCEDAELLRLAKVCKGREAEIVAVLDAGDTGPVYQRNLYHLLAHIGSDAALAAVKKGLETGRTRNIKEDAMAFIGHFDRDEVRDYLLARLAMPRAVYSGVIEALAQAKAKKAVEPLLKMAEGKDRDEIGKAARALGELGDAKVGERLAAAYPKLQYDTERIEVACAAAKLGVKRMEAEIRGLQKSSVDFVRTHAAGYLLSQGDLAGLDTYLAEFKNDRADTSRIDIDLLQKHIPDLPEVGEPNSIRSLKPEERQKTVAWLTANRSKLVFDPKARVFKLK